MLKEEFFWTLYYLIRRWPLQYEYLLILFRLAQVVVFFDIFNKCFKAKRL